MHFRRMAPHPPSPTNGGGLILLRSFIIALVMYFLAIMLKNLLDEERAWSLSIHEARIQVAETLYWFGTIFAAAYAGLYARFASQ